MFASEEQKAIEQAFPNEYKNFSPIGRGSYAKVFRAETQNNQVVAIKVIDLKNMQQEIIPYMENEIQLLSESDNRNVIKLFKSSKTADKLILILEYCFLDVEFMVKRYFKGKLPAELVIIILRQLANGLSYLHKKHIIHRDLKLENFAIQLSKEDQQALTESNDLQVFNRATYKLIDLGLAKKLGELNKYTNTWAGTELNMAPEILLEQEYSFEADMYSLGVCLYYMLVGKYPYFDPTNRQKIQDMIKRENADLSTINDQELKNLVEQMLKFDPKQRLSWKNLYQHKYFKLEDQGMINPLDLELRNNNDIIYSKKSQFMDYKEKQEFQPQDERKSNFQIPQQQQPIEQENTFQDFNQVSDNKRPISQLYDPRKKENDQIMQLYHIRNQYTLILKLQEFLNLIVNAAKDTKLSFMTMKGKFGMYEEYLQMVAKQLYMKLKQRFLFYQPTLNHLESFQLLQQLVNTQDSPKLDKIQVRQGSSEGVLAWMSKSVLRSIQCEPHDSINFNKQYEDINVEIYKELMKMYQDTFYKFDKQVDSQVNKVKCLLCLAMVNTARSRVLFKVDLQNIDYKSEELLIIKAKDEPDILLDKVTQILGQFSLNYN